jgi:hypothetical protein
MTAHFVQHKACRNVTMNVNALDERAAAAFYHAFAGDFCRKTKRFLTLRFCLPTGSPPLTLAVLRRSKSSSQERSSLRLVLTPRSGVTHELLQSGAGISLRRRSSNKSTCNERNFAKKHAAQREQPAAEHTTKNEELAQVREKESLRGSSF